MRHRTLLTGATVLCVVAGAFIAGSLPSGAGTVSGRAGTSDRAGPATAAGQTITIDFAGTAPVPAAPVPGARAGGQVSWLQDGSPEHFDPQQIYDALDLSTQLFFRTLTSYREDPGGGLVLVGDLATNAGLASDGSRVWTYHLRPGIAFDDGTPITAHDIGYGIARAFSQYGVFGPQYLQLALDPDGTYHGPYDGGADLPPGVSTPDDQTIVFTFASPHPELPFVVAMPTTTPVPKAKDTGAGYEQSWLASGPYRRRSAVPGSSLVLERNPFWRADSDPIRHQYVDTVAFDWTVDRQTQTDRVRAAQGGDASAVMTANVAADQIAAVQADPALLARTLSGATPTVHYLNINTARVTSVDVRRALNLAFDRAALVASLGGSAVADPSTTMLAPTVPGYLAYDAYPSDGHGDVARARMLLRGATPRFSLCFPDTADETQQADVVSTGFRRAGIRTTLTPIDVDHYYETIGTRGTGCDLMSTGWAADFPDGDSTLRVLLDGNLISDTGNVNFSYFNEPAVNAQLESLAAATDRAAVAPQYGQLDHDIMAGYAPLIPTVYPRVFSLVGPQVGGVFLSGLYGLPNLTGTYLAG